MKRFELFDLENKFTEFSKFKENFEFSWWVSDILIPVKEMCDKIRSLNIPSEAFTEYEKGRTDIIIKYAEKKDGQPIINNNNTVKIEQEKFDEYMKEIQAYVDGYKDIIDMEQKRRDEFNEFLNKEIDFKINKISKENLHKNLSGEDIIFLKKYELII